MVSKDEAALIPAELLIVHGGPIDALYYPDEAGYVHLVGATNFSYPSGSSNAQGYEVSIDKVIELARAIESRHYAVLECVGHAGGPLTFLGHLHVILQYALEHDYEDLKAVYVGQDYGVAEDTFRASGPSPCINLI